MTPLMIKDSPWDRAAFGIPAAELTEYSEAALLAAAVRPGHYTLKVDPLADKRLLQEHGFYYCDTLLEPWCEATGLSSVDHPDATLTRTAPLESLLSICHGAFRHGRYHRDFNLSVAGANLRYDNWLAQLHTANQVFGLLWQDELAGFIAYRDNVLVLHAVSESQRGQGRAKYWWSAACQALFAAGHKEVYSSISAANLAVLNLYASLGFRFRHPLDVYHRLVPAAGQK
jgi:hypothetical protein